MSQSRFSPLQGEAPQHICLQIFKSRSTLRVRTEPTNVLSALMESNANAQHYTQRHSECATPFASIQHTDAIVQGQFQVVWE